MIFYWNPNAPLFKQCRDGVPENSIRMMSGAYKSVVDGEGNIHTGKIAAVSLFTGEVDYLRHLDDSLCCPACPYYNRKKFTPPLQLSTLLAKPPYPLEEQPELTCDIETKGHLKLSVGELLKPGDFAFTYGHSPLALVFVCPCSKTHSHLRSIPLAPHAVAPNWVWDGNRECPTLQGPIALDDVCLWNGVLKNGIFEIIEDQ